MNNQFELKRWTINLNKNLNNQFDQNCQFEQKYQQLVRTKLSTINLKKQNVTRNLKRNINTLFEPRDINNQFEHKYQQSSLNRDTKTICREIPTINFGKKCQQSVWANLSTISLERTNINNQFGQNYQQSILN